MKGRSAHYSKQGQPGGMTEHSFSLVPFPDPDIPDIAISGTIVRDHNVLTVHYSLVGDVETYFDTGRRPTAFRQSELWTSTCFEFFLAVPDRPEYWEFNLSEQSIQQLQFEVRSDAQCFSVDSVLDLSPIIGSGMHIQAGVTSVIQSRDGHETYWALAHPSRQADFHLRESFILALEGSNYP
jgi:hypothetical protein